MVHNITSFPVTERPGTESYDPVLLGGKSVRPAPPAPLASPLLVCRLPRLSPLELARERWHIADHTSLASHASRLRACDLQLVDHYPYASVTSKEVLVIPSLMS